MFNILAIFLTFKSLVGAHAVQHVMSKKPKYLDRRANIVNTEVTCWCSCSSKRHDQETKVPRQESQYWLRLPMSAGDEPFLLYCRSLFFLLYFFFWPLCCLACTASIYTFWLPFRFLQTLLHTYACKRWNVF